MPCSIKATLPSCLKSSWTFLPVIDICSFGALDAWEYYDAEIVGESSLLFLKGHYEPLSEWLTNKFKLKTD